MKDTIAPGLGTTRKITVDRDRTIGFMGEALRVYGTPDLVRDIENTCRELLLEHSDEGEDSVGTNIELAHTAPTLLGMVAELTVTITKVEGRSVTFEIAGRDQVDPIAKGTHTRFIVDLAKTAKRLEAKAEKLAG